MESWNSADVLLCLTPILFVEFNIARLVLGLGDDDVSALDHMYKMLRSMPSVLSVEVGLLSSGVIFLVKCHPDLPPAIPIALQGIVHVQLVPLPLKPRLLVCENDKKMVRTLPMRAKKSPEATRKLRILKVRQDEQKKAVMQRGRKELEKARWMKVMQLRF